MRRRLEDPTWSGDDPLVPAAAVGPWVPSIAAPVAITGGTGFVGSHLVDTLCAAGLAPRVLVRDAASPRWIDGRSVEWVEGSLEDEAALERLVEGAGTVIHLAGVLRGANEAEFMTGNRDGTARLVAATSRCAGDARLVYVSSQAAVGPSPTPEGIDPDARPAPVSAYGRSKLAAEGEVSAYPGSWVILRPPAIFGPRDTDVFEFFKLASRGLLGLPSGERWITVSFVGDVVTAVIAAAGAAPGRVYHLGEASPYTMEEMLTLIAEGGGVRARVVRIPAWVLRTAGAGASHPSRAPLRHLEVPVFDEPVEVMAGHVGVDLEQVGDLPGRHRVGRFAGRHVDATTRRIAEGRGEVADGAFEVVGVHEAPGD